MICACNCGRIRQRLQQPRPDHHAPGRAAAGARRVQSGGQVHRQRSEPLTPSLQPGPRADLLKAVRRVRWPIMPKRRSSTPTAAGRRPIAASPTPRWANSTRRWPIATRHRRKRRTQIYTLTSRGNVYLGKGDLDAALRDYNEALKINPNYVRAYVGRGQLFEKRRDLAAARADYRSGSRRGDQGRRYRHHAGARYRQGAAGGCAGRADAGKAVPAAARRRSGPRKIALIVGNGAYRTCAARQPAARRQTDRIDLRDLGFADGDAGARSRPRQILRRAARHSAWRPKRRIGRWSIMPATAWRSAASTIWFRPTPN